MPDREVPICPGCSAEMVERLNPATSEQRWCGTWFDHPPVPFGGCTRFPTILIPSQELLDQEAHMRAEHESRLDMPSSGDPS